uniref:Uncharacterized protein n=1 Tax=Anopheles atroparvus TaxID=41427 RepID=A0A182JJ53_ANOAO
MKVVRRKSVTCCTRLLLVSVVLAAGEKKMEKRPTKKAHSSKPTKTPKSIVEEFTALPPSDVDFIKELDRQFREHGNKIRIKVERSNGTDGKNIKRTIEGDLGYGHYSNQAETGYHFSKPKYMIYPYSQHDIPPVRSTHSTAETQYYDTPKAPTARPTKRPNYRKTTVTPTHVTFHSTVQPEPAYHYQTYHPEQQHHAQVHDQGHTQIQYQYVAQQPTGQQGEDHEAHYVYSKPVVNFVTPLPDGGHHGHADPYQHQQQQHHHQPAQKYPNFAEYHHHHRPQQQQEEDYLPEPKLVENYPSHKHTRVVYKSPSLKAELQQEAAMEQHDHYHHHHQLEQQQQQQQDVVHHLAHHQERQQQHQYILQEVYPSQASYFEDKSFVESAGPQETTDRSETASPHYNTEEVVAITQKPKRLYNYHAHSSGHGHGGGSRGSRMAAASGSRSRASGSGGAKATGAATKRDTTSTPYTEDEFRKVNKMVQRLKKKSRTTVDDSGMTTVGLSVSSTSPSPRMENGRESQYVINVAPEDEVIIHEGSATERVSDRGPTDEQTPQDFVHEALRLRKQYMQNGPKGTTAMPASSFVEYTTVKYDRFGPSKAPDHDREAEPHVIYHSKPVPTKPPAVPVYAAPSTAPQTVPTYRPKHIKPKPTKPMLVHTVTPYVAVEQEQPEPVPTVVYRPKEPKLSSKPEHVSKTVHSSAPGKATAIKQQDTAASNVFVHAVRPDEASFGSSYSTHHDSGSSYQEFHKFTPTEAVAAAADSQGSSSILAVQKNYHAIETIKQVQMEPEPQPSEEPYRYKSVNSHQVESQFNPSPIKYERDPVPAVQHKETYTYHPPKSHHVDPPKQLQHDSVTTTYHGSKSQDTQEKHVAEVSQDFLKLATARPAKHKYADLPKPSPAPSYSKVTSYPTLQSTSSQREAAQEHREKVPFDPYKYRPSPTPEVSSAGHGFQKISSSPASYPKYIPAKMPSETSQGSETNAAYSFKQAHPSAAESFASYLPSSTPESFSAAPQEFPKIFAASPTPYTKYSGSPSSPSPSGESLYEFPHMKETPKSFSKFHDPKSYSNIDPSEQPFKTLSTTIFMKPSPSEDSYTPPVTAGKPIQNLTTSIGFKASPSDATKTEYFTNPEVTTYYVFPNGTEVKLGDDPSKIPQEFRITTEDGSFLTSNYTTKLAEDFAMKYNWDSLHTVADGEYYLGSASDATLKALSGSTSKFHEPIEYVVRDKKKMKPVVFAKPSLKPIKTVTIYKSTHRSSDDGEGGFEPMVGVAPQMDKKSELPGGDDEFYYTNEATDDEEDPTKASKKNAVFMPAQGMGGRMPGPGMMMKFAPGPSPGPREPQGQPVQDMDMSAEPSKKHQYFVLYHIEDKEKKPARPQHVQHPPPQPPAPVVPKQEIHYHYSEKESEEPEVTHEHYNYHHEETIEDSDDDIQHHYVNPSYGKYNYRPNIAHPSYQRPLRDSMAAGSETTLKVVDPDAKNARPLEITKQEYMRHVQNAVMRYMRQLQDEGRLPVIASRDSDDTHKAFEELDLAALLGGANPKQKFQLNGSLRANVPANPSHYKPMKSVPSSSTYKSTTAAPQNAVRLGKNTYTAGKPLKVAIESLQDSLSSNVDLTVKGNKQPIKPDLSAIDVGQSYLHGPTFEQSSPKESGPSPKTKLHFSQASHHDINSMLNAKDSSLRTSLKGSYLDHGANQGFGSIKGGSANVGASISFGKGMQVAEDDNKMVPEALDAPIQIINGIPITNPYNIDINTLRYMLGGLAQAQAEQHQSHTPKEPTLKLKGSNWMSLPTVASPAQVFSSHIPTYQHPPSEVNNYKYNANFDASNFKIKFPKNLKLKNPGGASGGADALASGSMNYASWGEPPKSPVQGNLFQGLLKQNAIMSKKAATSDWKPTTVKPTTGPSKAVKIDTNLRPPPPVVKG